MEIGEERRNTVFDRIGGVCPVKNRICKYWLQGRCNRNPCKFLHSESPPSKLKRPNTASSTSDYNKQSKKNTWVKPISNCPKNATMSTKVGDRISSVTCSANTEIIPNQQRPEAQPIQCNAGIQNQQKRPESPIQCRPESQPTQCKYWVTGNCVHGDKCKDVHSWFTGSDFTMLTKLEGHKKAITGIAFPCGSDKLYSCGKDGFIQAWDCNSGQCAGSLCLEGEVGCLTSEGSWLFAGFPNTIKAWNVHNRTEFSANGSFGQVHCIKVDEDMIYAGTEDGNVYVWKYSPQTNIPEQAAVLKGHRSAVCSLVIGGNMLYSGSRDTTIKKWDLQNLQCQQTLHGHTKVVTSLICWEHYLLSASLDNTLKAWDMTENGTLDIVFETNLDHGVIAFCGIHDSEDNPILLCSYTDKTIRLHDLPSFAERGRIFSKREVGVIQIGTHGLFFAGDATGEVLVCKLIGKPKV